MRSNVVKSVLIGIVLTLGAGSSAFAKEHSPEALSRVLERRAGLAAQDLHPVVVFDLDDTLTNTRERNFQDFKRLRAQPQVQADFPEAAAHVAQLAKSR